MEQNICCKEKLDLTNTTVNTLIVNCCCKCGNNGGDKPEPPIPPEKDYKTMTVKVDLANSDPATCCSYADDAVDMVPGSAEWDKFFGHYPVLLKEDKEVGKLNPNDFTKFVDGTAADITSGAAGDVMIAFPRRGLKIETVGDIMTVSMTDDPDAEGFEYLAHVRGDERRDVFYLGAYEGVVDVNSKLRSLNGKMPTTLQTIAVFRTQARANGIGYEQNGFYQLTFRQAMYILKYRNLNSQAAVGRGFVDRNASLIPTGGTEAKGMDWGETTGKQHMKLFGIEDFWGNANEWTEGIVTDNVLNILTATDNFNDAGVDYINQGKGVPADGYNNICIMLKPAGTSALGFVEKQTASISQELHFCDQTAMLQSSIAVTCGVFDGASLAGIFFMAALFPASFTHLNTGARLMYL